MSSWQAARPTLQSACAQTVLYDKFTRIKPKAYALQTDRETDTPSYRIASSPLESNSWAFINNHANFFLFLSLSLSFSSPCSRFAAEIGSAATADFFRFHSASTFADVFVSRKEKIIKIRSNSHFPPINRTLGRFGSYFVATDPSCEFF